jgi:hypothetical protein
MVILSNPPKPSIEFALKTLKSMNLGHSKDSIAFQLSELLLKKKLYQETETSIREISDGPKKNGSFSSLSFLKTIKQVRIHTNRC